MTSALLSRASMMKYVIPNLISSALLTIKHVQFENLTERVGAYSFAFSTRSHIHDQFHTSWITDSNNAVDFLTEVLNISPSDVAQKFELWAIAREKGIVAFYVPGL